MNYICKMNRKIKLLFVTLLFLQSLVSQEKGGLLWKVEGNGLAKPSYLFGTCHVLNDKVFNLVPGFWKAYNSCDYVMIECGLDSMLDPDLHDSFVKNSLLKIEPKGFLTSFLHSSLTNPPIAKYTPNEDSLKFVEKLKKEIEEEITGASDDSMSIENLNLESTNSEKGWTVYPPLSAHLDSLKSDGLNPMDAKLLNHKYLENRKKRYCESVAKQYYSLDSLIELLFPGIKDSAKIFNYIQTKPNDASIDSVCDAYLKQDINSIDIETFLNSLSLSKTVNNNETMSQNICKLLLIDRNKNWLVKFNSYFKEGSHFVGVGFGHLPGENGLIQMLRRQGYTVTPVNN